MLRKFFTILSLLFFAVGVAHAAILTEGELDLKCQSVSKKTVFHVSRDDEAKALAEEFLTKLGIRATVVICSGASGPHDVAREFLLTSGPDQYFFIALNSLVRMALGDALRGVIGHEVGHLQDKASCAVSLEQENIELSITSETYIACEHAADVVGERLAGRGQVAHALARVATYLRQRQGDNDPKTEDIVFTLYRRISLLR